MIKHSVLGVLLAKAQDAEMITANVTMNATMDANATVEANATVVEPTPGEKMAAFEESVSDLFLEYGLSEEMLQAKQIALGQIDDLESDDIYDKVDALAEVVDPITKDLAEMSGDDFVKTMSEEAVEFYAEAAAYWATEEKFSPYNSVKWGTKIPKRTNPKNAVKCAAQKGKCECHAESLVYYGLKTSDGTLDTSENYAVAEADHSGYTFCKNEVFGNPLPGDKRKKYCFCDESVAMQGAIISECAKTGENCNCDLGGTIFYGSPTLNGRTIDITQDHWEIDSGMTPTKCEASVFGASNDWGTCYCELPRPPKHNYCEAPVDDMKEVGCYEDKEKTPDFEEQLTQDGQLINPKECGKLAFEKGYIYAGLSDGGKCWGATKKIGKFGESSKCNYPCPNGKDTCGGKHAITAFMMDYQKDNLCGFEQKFDELRSDGSTNYGNGGVLSNPSGDGETFVWTPRVEGDPFNMIAVRSKSGSVKGFKLLQDNPYYSSFKFLSWNEAEGKLEANGVVYSAVAEYQEEKLVEIEEVVEGAPIMDEFGYIMAYEEPTVYVYTPKPSGAYKANSALSGYSKSVKSYYKFDPSTYDYTYAYYYGYNHGNVYIFGEDDFDSLYEEIWEYLEPSMDYYDTYYYGYDDYDWETEWANDWATDWETSWEENWETDWDDFDWETDYDYDYDWDLDIDWDEIDWETDYDYDYDWDLDVDWDEIDWESEFGEIDWETEVDWEDEMFVEFYLMPEGSDPSDYYYQFP